MPPGPASLTIGSDPWRRRLRPRRAARKPRLRPGLRRGPRLPAGCCCSTGTRSPTGRFSRCPGELLHHHGTADERRLRVHGHAHQRAARRAAQPRRGGLRPQRADVPARAVRRVQGEPAGDAGRLPQSAQPDLRGAGRARHRPAECAGLRGRRRDRHPGHPGRERGHGRADRHRRPGRPAARRRPRHGAADPAGHHRDVPLHPRGRRGEVRPDPAAVPRLRRHPRRPQRQPARHPRGGGEDRDQVDPAVRLAGGAGQPGRRGQGQGRRRAPRAPW